jgi:hypothetical protein
MDIMTLETLFLIVMAAGLILPVIAVIAGLGIEVLSDPARGQNARMSQTAISRLMARHEKKSSLKKFLKF